MARIYIGIGSNIDPMVNVKRALQMINEQVQLEAISDCYETKPVGMKNQQKFINAVAKADTILGPKQIKYEVLRDIEQRLGRVRSADKYADRTIDLDLLLYNQLEVSEPDLKLPDPDIVVREFIFVPLYQLAPRLVLPGGVELSALARNCAGTGMIRLEEYSDKIRMELKI